MKDSRFVKGIESLIFDHKPIVIGIFALITLFLGYTAATQLRIDAGFSKQLPLKHEYMQTFVEYFDEFGGADRVLVALVAKDGDMFDAEFFETLKQATDAVFFVPGVDRPRVTSLFTPNTRYLEVVEDGIQSGPVIPADFKPEPESLEKVRKNILKAGLVGPGECIPLVDGELGLSRWQNIFFCEFDGPRTRRSVVCTLIADD